MGTDIHGVFQRFDSQQKRWVGVPSNYSQNRHYQLFAVLADVRNGTGFAGVKTGDAVEPISEPRGYPLDFVRAIAEYDDSGDKHIVKGTTMGAESSPEGNDDYYLLESPEVRDPRRQEFYKPEDNVLWMGDHSHSWLTGEEMLAWFESAPIVTKRGIISLKQFESWPGEGAPEGGWSGGVWGQRCKTVTPEGARHILAERAAGREVPDFDYYVDIEWRQSLKEELAYFFEEVARLVTEHGQVRFVFGFDS